MLKQRWQIVSKLLMLFFLGLAGWLVFKEIHHVGWSKIIVQLMQLPLNTFLWALLFVFLDYLAFSGYDFLALWYLQKKVKTWLVLKTSFISFAVTNTTGHAYLAGGSIRYFFYSKAGLTQVDIVKMIVFESLTYLVGMGIVLDACLLISHFSGWGHYEYYLTIFAGLISVLLLVYYCLPAGYVLKQIKLPLFQMKIKQALVGICDCVSASLVFYILFRAHLSGDYLRVVSIFFVAQAIGIASQVPGGIGVFEAAFLYLFPHSDSQRLLLIATLISFRILYYFLPLIISCLLLFMMWSKKIFRRVLH